MEFPSRALEFVKELGVLVDDVENEGSGIFHRVVAEHAGRKFAFGDVAWPVGLFSAHGQNGSLEGLGYGS